MQRMCSAECVLQNVFCAAYYSVVYCVVYYSLLLGMSFLHSQISIVDLGFEVPFDAAQVRYVLQFVAVCCSVLQCVAVCCSVLWCVAVLISRSLLPSFIEK